MEKCISFLPVPGRHEATSLCSHLAPPFSLFGCKDFSSLQPDRPKDVFIRLMDLRQIFPFLLLLWQADFFNRLLNG